MVGSVTWLGLKKVRESREESKREMEVMHVNDTYMCVHIHIYIYCLFVFLYTCF